MSPLLEVCGLFLRLGVTAFGGPAAHIAVMEQECVVRRGWITREQFLDVLGMSNLIPGPTSTELAMHVGWHRAGWTGLIVAGLSFILPSALLVAGLAGIYVELGPVPAFAGLLRAVKPVVVVVVCQALLGLGRGALKSPRVMVVAAGAALAVGAGANEAAVLVAAGLVSMLVSVGGGRVTAGILITVAFAAGLYAEGSENGMALSAVFGYFARTGAAIFGSGYVLFAILRHDLVEQAQWITESQLLDAIAIGQVTPGPVFTAATFIGYILAGPVGALVATVGIFLPAFVFSALSTSLLHRLRNAAGVRDFLDGVNGAAVALIAMVAWALARVAIVDPLTAGVAFVAGWLIWWWRVNSSWVLAGAAVAGVLLG